MIDLPVLLLQQSFEEFTIVIILVLLGPFFNLIQPILLLSVPLYDPVQTDPAGPHLPLACLAPAPLLSTPPYFRFLACFFFTKLVGSL